MALCAAVHAATGVLDRQGRDLMRPSRRAPEGRYGRYRTPNWGPEEPTAPGTLAALESLRPLGVEPPQTERTDRLLRSLQVETGGVGQ